MGKVDKLGIRKVHRQAEVELICQLAGGPAQIPRVATQRSCGKS